MTNQTILPRVQRKRYLCRQPRPKSSKWVEAFNDKIKVRLKLLSLVQCICTYVYFNAYNSENATYSVRHVIITLDSSCCLSYFWRPPILSSSVCEPTSPDVWPQQRQRRVRTSHGSNPSTTEHTHKHRQQKSQIKQPEYPNQCDWTQWT